MPMPRKPLRLTTAAPLMVGATLALAFAVVLALGILGGNAVVQQSLINNGHETLSVSGRLLFNPVFKLDVSAMQPIVNQLLAQESVVYVAVRDKDGMTLVDATKEQFKNDSLIQNYIKGSATNRTSPLLSGPVDSQLGPYLATRGPIYAGSVVIGTLDIVFDQRPQQAALQSTLRPIAIAVGVVSVGAILLILALMRYATAPLQALTEAAKVITAGNLDAPVPIGGMEETSILGATFEGMRVALKQLTQTLEQKVEERTAQLAVARQEAEEANRLKSEFLAVMSHELRTPLNAIIGFTGIMMFGKDTLGKEAHMIQRIRSNSERLLTLIDDILDLSRIEAGRMDLTPGPLSVRQLTQEVQSEVAVLAEQKQLGLSCQIAQDVPDIVQMDEDALRKILTNLLSNAVKFTDQGQVRLNMTRQDHMLIIEVGDTGIGIPAHQQEVIFETFRQVDSSSTRAYGGTGLGLSIVRHLCTAMHGTIDVKSTSGKGSIFTVKLPLEETVKA